MSEYQYYEFQSIDRPLSPEEIQKIHTYSSRAVVNAHRAIFTYSYGDFRYDEVEVLKKYFDIMLYMANWGSQRLLMKFPADSISQEEIQAYACDLSSDFCKSVKIWQSGPYVLLDLDLNEEEGLGWFEGEGILDEMLALRSQIQAGDYRVLYLACLHLVYLEYFNRDYLTEENKALLEPPVPPNLGRLDHALKSFVNFWGIDQDLIEAASENSPTSQPPSQDLMLRQIAQLSEEEKNHYLALLLSDHNKAHLSLVNHLRATLLPDSVKAPPRRKLGELISARIKQEEIRLQKEKQAAKEAHLKKMESIRQKQKQIWEDIHAKADLKLAKGYAEATALLKDLKEYFAHIKDLDSFEAKMKDILDKYGKSAAFRRRLKDAEII